jgi:peptidoglycan/xylan/chitin deacetylase (PgdA/CDA1 family)
VLWRSLAKAPFEMLGDLDRWREPTLDSDAEVIAKGLGLFYIRRRSDDLAQVVPSNNAELFSVIQREVRAGDTVIDAGANIGAVTVYLASRVGPTGNVLAIEMIPKTATCLRTNVELNYLRNVTLVGGESRIVAPTTRISNRCNRWPQFSCFSLPKRAARMIGSFGGALKPLTLSILGSSVAAEARIPALVRSQALAILNFHRVDDAEGSAGAAMNPTVFDELVSWLKRRFAIVTFNDLSLRKFGGKPPLILSFDDGYRDFIDIVVPIVEKHGLRVNQNLIPAALNSGLPPMNVQLQDFIRTAPTALLRETPLPGLPAGADPNDRVKSGLRASKALKSCPIAKQKEIFAKLGPDFQRFDGFRPTPVMSIEEARQVTSVHEIGAHSFEHATMGEETDAYLTEDINKCLSFFMTRLGIRPTVYAFANGSARASQTELVRAAGVNHVLLTGEQFSRPSNWLHKRFTIFGSTITEARFRALGGLKSP